MSMPPHQPTGPLPGTANPTWLGHVQEQHYRPAPGHQGNPLAPVLAQVPQPVSAVRRMSGSIVVLSVGGGALAFLSLFIVLPFLFSNVGPAGFVIGFLASLIPLSVVLLAVWAIDRWEPEPRRLLVFAFTWGAAVSIAVTLLIQPLFVLTFPSADPAELRTYLATVQAPIVEEFAKSLGLLTIMLLARRHIDGPVDGVVFAFTIAGGFAFTENILYFGRALAESPDPGVDLAQVFFLRGVMSPFAHALFTGTTGLIMGLAARRASTGGIVLAFVLGLLPAMFLHNRWNSMGQGFFAEYVTVQVPLFILAVLGIVLLRVAEKRLTRQRLGEYAAAGWFTPAEVELLATLSGRQRALAWAGTYGRKQQMRDFIRAATRLANIRQRILAGRQVQDHQGEERIQLQRVLAMRAALAG